MFKEFIRKLSIIKDILLFGDNDVREQTIKKTYDKLKRQKIEEITRQAIPVIGPAALVIKNNGVTLDSIESVNDAFKMQATNVSLSMYSWFANHGFIGYQACAIIAQHWLVIRGCSVAANEAAAANYSLKSTGDIDQKILDDCKQLSDANGIKKQISEFETFKRVFGFRILVFRVESDDPKYYEKPFSMDNVKKGTYQGMHQVDPYWIAPVLTGNGASDPNSPDFYKPEFWQISGKLYHKSHLHIDRHIDVPDVLKPTYQYGGLSCSQLVYQAVYNAERSAAEMQPLLASKRQNLLKTDVENALSNYSAFTQKLEIFAGIRDNFGVGVMNYDDEFTQFDTALSELPNVVDKGYEIVAAIFEVPVNKLFGLNPGGLNSSGQFESRLWQEKLSAVQQNSYNEILIRDTRMQLKSTYDIDTKKADYGFIVEWESKDQLTEIEKSQIFAEKVEALRKLVVDIGALSPFEARQVIAEDPYSNIGEAPNDEESESEWLDTEEVTDV